MTGSPGAFIKEEGDDFQFNPHKYMAVNGSYNMHQQYNGHFAASSADIGAINPTELSMGSNSMMGNTFGSSSFMASNSGIGDDELLDLGDLNSSQDQFNSFGYANGNGNGNHVHNGDMYHNGGISVGHQNGHTYSNTPDAPPIMSPFVTNNFNYDQYRPGTQQPGFSQSVGTPMGINNARIRHTMDRHTSDSRSPMTPTTPASRAMQLGTPDSVVSSNQDELNRLARLQAGSMYGSAGSNGSGFHSPLPSPHSHIDKFPHPQITEILSAKHGSLPAHMENGHSTLNSQELKRKRRRESHNAVERRRRDNINERIHDLSRLVPQHRLEDEKVKKHIVNNGPLSPSLTATGMSPPHATSLLAGGTGRRAAPGNITQGLPLEEKDKGPNKGDILNGAVSWTRDLMWQLNHKNEQEERLRQYIHELGGVWPLEMTEDEKRMNTELKEAVSRNGVNEFRYSRTHGSGLRVPKHTTYNGDPVSPQSMSPTNHNGNQQWMSRSDSGSRSFSLREDEEFGMDMN
ncbi:hypothetical protein BLS_001145 [Venturia inaequalis]|uniref:BHLH domain-containing protein n=1 Tax=Venturia inaequalis TaxID=5025 RepID=A0A8H3VMW1_VENIN|nr:hypothetical protein BLS_001145 [Venturia inaequalis]KAE9982384.1 hypothetical protein EG328_010918 [Venturia inaequalis]KAE9989823.1 hypothetical protein EG327_002211 [Venturia inaequalis]RDI85606.1 Translation initiation factor [Venturia inaequalis]